MPRIGRINGNRPKHVNGLNFGLRIGTWNVRSLYQAGAVQSMTKEVEKYNLDVVALQEIRWTETGTLNIEESTILYGASEPNHTLGTGFILRKAVCGQILDFQSVNPRISLLTLELGRHKLALINCHAPTEDSEDYAKDTFYDELETVFDNITNDHHIMVLGDLNAKIGKEQVFLGTIGKHSLHDMSNDNGIRFINYCTSKGLFISSTEFERKNIYKGTWVSPDGRTVNQIDHVAIDTNIKRWITNVKTARGAECGSDHFLVKIEVYIQWKPKKHTKLQKVTNFGYNKLVEDKDMQNTFKINLTNRFEVLAEKTKDYEDVERSWKGIRDTMTETAKEVIPKLINGKQVWFDEVCVQAIQERQRAKQLWIQGGSENYDVGKALFDAVRRRTQTTLRRVKRSYIKNITITAQEDFHGNKSKELYRKVKVLKGEYRQQQRFIKNKNGRVLTNDNDIANRWVEYFNELLNCEEPSELFEFKEPATVEMEYPPPTLEEIKGHIKELQNGKSEGEDGISAEMIKAGGEIFSHNIHKLVEKIWTEQVIPEEWKVALICPIHKKKDKMVCDNYRGIALLNISYKVFSKCLLTRIKPLAGELIGEYQGGFQPGKSTTDNIFFLKQVCEKFYEYNKEVHLLFVDFQKAYDSIHRASLFKTLIEFGVSKKLVQLVALCLDDTRAKIKLRNKVTGSFQVNTGLRQGDGLSPVLFNLALEKISREMDSLKLQGVQVMKNNITHLAYADDIVLLSHTKENLKVLMKNLENTASKFGLRVNASKTEYMVIGRDQQPDNQEIQVDNSIYKRVQNFKYLGTIISENSSTELEIKARIQAGNRCCYALNNILKSRSLSRALKLRLYKTLILPVILYGCQSWSTRKQDLNKLAVFERRCLRKIFGPVQDIITGEWRRRYNKELEDLYSEPNIIGVMKSRRLEWAGHLSRMDKERWPKLAMQMIPDGKRPIGRPRKRWMDGVREDLQQLDAWENWEQKTTNRKDWRALVKSSRGPLGLIA